MHLLIRLERFENFWRKNDEFLTRIIDYNFLGGIANLLLPSTAAHAYVTMPLELSILNSFIYWFLPYSSSFLHLHSFFCFSYVTSSSLNSPGELPMMMLLKKKACNLIFKSLYIISNSAKTNSHSLLHLIQYCVPRICPIPEFLAKQ